MSNIKQLKDVKMIRNVTKMVVPKDGIIRLSDLPEQDEMIYCPWIWQIKHGVQITRVRWQITQLRYSKLLYWRTEDLYANLKPSMINDFIFET